MIVVYGPPGTGKTHFLASRATMTHSIAFTFTASARDEARVRGLGRARTFAGWANTTS